MKLITRDSDYAIQAICFMAKDSKDKIAVSELAKKLNIPKAFLRKILQILNREKILKSYKGQSGGFSLAVSPNNISLLDLIEIFQGPLQLNDCKFKRQICPNIKSCKIRQKMDNIQEYVGGQLRNVTVASLLK